MMHGMNAAAMVERLWDLLLSQPNLLAAHLSHYAMLMRDETELAVTELRYRSLMLVMLLGCGLLFVGLLGVALLLWGTTPAEGHAHAWVLWLVPCVPLAGAVFSLVALLRKRRTPLWRELQAQISIDVALLKNNAH